MASPAGIQLIATINQELLKSAKLTGIWENRLRRIERGDYSAADFITELKNQINEIVINVLNDSSAQKIITNQGSDNTAKNSNTKTDKTPKKRTPRKPKYAAIEEIPCPLCGKGHIIKGKTAFGCSNYAGGCTTTYPFTAFPEDSKPDELYKLIKNTKK